MLHFRGFKFSVLITLMQQIYFMVTFLEFIPKRNFQLLKMF